MKRAVSLLLLFCRPSSAPSPKRWRAVGLPLSAGRAARRALLAVVISLMAQPMLNAQATGTLTTLHSFSGGDGKSPSSTLAQSSDGSFYGATYLGGANGDGTVFQITPAGVLTVLYSFSGSDGENPYAALVPGGDGSFYGVTYKGGASGDGTVFQITLAGVLTSLHSFSGNDGENPVGLVPDGGGNFYGTTNGGGASGDGTVFQITPSGVITSLHSFSGSDGASPAVALVPNGGGNFYGTTNGGGASGDGTVFQITPSGVLTVLYSFSGSDGKNPAAALVRATDGSFYGTTYGGGANNYGTVFQITPAGVLTTLHNFSNGVDGANPDTVLIPDSGGNFYGTTFNGGSYDGGAIFQITPAGVLTILYSFSGGSDGAYPEAALVQGSDGSFYGTTNFGLPDGDGTVFKLSVPGVVAARPAFFAGELLLGSGVYYLAFSANGNIFGYYSFLTDPDYIYHFDLGYEYIFDAADGLGGVYFYDFTSGHFFYTSPTFAFPYLYDFSLDTVLYYYPDPNNPGYYNTNGVRYFYDFATGQIFSM